MLEKVIFRGDFLSGVFVRSSFAKSKNILKAKMNIKLSETEIPALKICIGNCAMLVMQKAPTE